MTLLCTIEEAAELVGVPEASLRSAAETHGFLYRFDEEVVRVARAELEKLTPFALRQADEDANAPTVAERLQRAIERLKSPPPPEPEQNRNIPTDIRRAVFERDGEVCAYCGDTEGPFALDHIHPFSRGGLHTMENLTVACNTCNSSKGDKLLKNWDGGPK